MTEIVTVDPAIFLQCEPELLSINETTLDGLFTLQGDIKFVTLLVFIFSKVKYLQSWVLLDYNHAWSEG